MTTAERTARKDTAPQIQVVRVAAILEELEKTRRELREGLEALKSVAEGAVAARSATPPGAGNGHLEGWFQGLVSGAHTGNDTSSSGQTRARRGLTVSKEQLAAALGEARSTGGGGTISVRGLERRIKETAAQDEPAGGSGGAVSLSLSELAGILKGARDSSKGTAHPKAPEPDHAAERPAEEHDAARRIAEAAAQIQAAGATAPRLDINLTVNLIRWVGTTRRRIGLAHMQDVLETYMLTGHLPSAIQMIVYRVSAMGLESDPDDVSKVSYDDIADSVSQLHGVLYAGGGPPTCLEVDFDISEMPLTEASASHGATVTGSNAPDEELAAVLPAVEQFIHGSTDADIFEAADDDSPTIVSEPPAAAAEPRQAAPALAVSSTNGSAPKGRKTYASDLTEAQWRGVEELVPAHKPGGRPPKYTRREVLNGILYQVHTGASWRSLPQDLPPWKIVHHYFRTWREEGLWEPIAATLAYMRMSVEAEPQQSGDGEQVAEGSILDQLARKAAARGAAAG